MLQIKLEQENNSKTWYKIKINGATLDHGILTDEKETIQYSSITFPKEGDNNTYISLSCPYEKELLVKEIHVDDVCVVVGDNWIQKNKDWPGIISGSTADINSVIENNFKSIRPDIKIREFKDWVFVLKPTNVISFWNDEKKDFCDDFKLKEPEKLRGYHKYSFSDGRRYEGYFNNNEPDGEGTMYYPDGDIEVFSGSWHNGIPVAFSNGSILYRNGDEFTGKIGAYSICPGEGVYNYFNSENGYLKYEGRFSNGKFIGKGKLTYREDSNQPFFIYQGSFRDGIFNSTESEDEETLIYKNGDIYRGKFFNGMKYGDRTTEIYKEGEIAKFEGAYAHGERIYGTVYYRNGDFYKGDLKSGEGYRDSFIFEGRGMYILKSGEVVDAYWQDSKVAGTLKIYYGYESGMAQRLELIKAYTSDPGILDNGYRIYTQSGGGKYTGNHRFFEQVIWSKDDPFNGGPIETLKYIEYAVIDSGPITALLAHISPETLADDESCRRQTPAATVGPNFHWLDSDDYIRTTEELFNDAEFQQKMKDNFIVPNKMNNEP